MAVTQLTATGNGSTTTYNHTIEYQKDADLKATLNGAATTAFTLPSGTSVQFNTAPANGVAIRIYRDTDIETPKVTFAAGSAIKATDLNNSYEQLRFKVDEEVMTDDIADLQITGAKIADNTIADAKITGLASSKLTGALPALDGSNLTGIAGTLSNGDKGDITVSNSTNTWTIDDGVITSAKLHGDLLVTSSEQASHSANDTSILTTSAANARYYGKGTVEEIQSGETWSAADDKVATTAAIDARITDLVDDVGGFVPIANETSFPNANPDVNNGSGTLISIKALASALTSNGSGVATIANGNVANNATITINGLENSTTYAAGFGMIVETTSTLHTYTFHRQTPKATEVTTVATNISNVNTVAGNNSNITTVAGANSNISTVATNITNVNNVGGSIANVNTVGSNISTVNDFAARYRVASSAPGSDNDEGDLYFNTTSNELQVYNGSSWQGGVTATGNLVSTAGSTMTGDLVMDNQADIRFEEATANGSNYIALQAPAAIASNVTLTLPAADGSNGQSLTTNGSGTLSWGSASDATKMPLAGGNFTGDIQLDAQQEVRFADSDSSNYVGFKAPATVGSNVIWTLPTADGSANQLLKTDGSGVLSWVSDSALTLLDEDNFASDDATKPASQQSVKAYIAATSQPLDADLTSLASCQTGGAGALAALTQTEIEILDGATVTTTELNLLDGKTAIGDAVLSSANEWTAGQKSQITTATHSSGSTYDFDVRASNCFKLTISAAVELGFSYTTNCIGQSGTIEIVNGAITPTWASEIYWAGGTSKAASLTQNATSVLAYYVFAQDKVLIEAMLDVKNTA